MVHRFAMLLAALVCWIPTLTFADEKSDKPSSKATSGPVSLSAKFSKAKVKPGDEVELKVTVKMESGWHIYAVDKPTGVSVKTTLKLTPPKGLSEVGKWKIPEPKLDVHASEETHMYEDEVTFSHKVKVAQDASGKLETKVVVGFMVCDSTNCLPPKKITLTVPVEIAK